MLTPQILLYVGLAATLSGTIGGFIENKAKPGTGWYKLGAVLASIGVDLTFLTKLGGGAS
jgi:hypothetical protein